MGNGKSSTRPLSEQDSLEFYTVVSDPNVGQCEVYSVKHLPMCYIIKVKRKSSSIYEMFRNIENHQSKSLISMYAFVKVNYCDCNDFVSEGIVFYWQYFNFYLEDMLQRKVSKQSYFTEKEIWHFVQVCMEGYLVFKKHKVFYSFSPQTIVLTPEGKLKLFWANILQYNNHLPYFGYFATGGSEYQISYYSPEQLYSMKTKNRNLHLDFEKCNIFSFGMLLLYLCTLVNPIIFYKNLYDLDYVGIQHLFTKIKSMYSKQICMIVGRCLQLNPAKRYAFQNIQDYYGKFMSQQYYFIVHGKQILESSLDQDKNDKIRRISLKKKSF